jgi:hypothetical protein
VASRPFLVYKYLLHSKQDWFLTEPIKVSYETFIGLVRNQKRFRKKTNFLEPGHQFNFDQWSSAVKTANEKMKILLGIPASRPAGEGYEPVENIKKIYDSIKSATNFAGKTCNYCCHYQ